MVQGKLLIKNFCGFTKILEDFSTVSLFRQLKIWLQNLDVNTGQMDPGSLWGFRKPNRRTRGLIGK